LNTLIILSALGLAGLFSEIFGFKKLLMPLIYIGLSASLVAAVADWNTNRSYFNDMMVMDNYAIAFTTLIIFISLIWFLIAPGYFKDKSTEVDHATLIIFAVIGGLLMASFSNMIMLFLGLEILSISMYILAGSNKNSLLSNEAALKYFLLGSFATCFLLFGIALIYGSTGSFHVNVISGNLAMSGSRMFVYIGVFMMMIAMAFKVSAAPFHFWAPDVYQGSPTIITAFMSTVVKTAAFAAFLRLFHSVFGGVESIWSSTLWILSALTILTGNITAVFQTNLKRMLAYSSVAHAGYMLLSILAMNNASAGSLLFYTIAYSVSSIASFAILIAVSNSTGDESIASFNGLGKKNPLLAFVTVIAMLSLAGIPPTAGFFAKYYIFSAAISNNLTSLVLIAVAGSLIGVFYYFRIIIALFRDNEPARVEMSTGYKFVLILTSLIAIVLGVLPGLVSGLL
jgi:NADH-quinone oxidoreductase subunit N